MIDFRKEALEAEFNPDKLEDELKLVSPPVYMIVLSLLAVAVSFFVWGIFGTVTDEVTMKGIIYPPKGVESISMPYAGTVRTLFVMPGDQVSAGQRLGMVEVEGRYSVISATCGGKIVSVKEEQSGFESFEPVISIQKDNPTAVVNTVIAFADFKTFRELSQEVEVQVNPAYLPIERNGYIPGRISKISTVPGTRREALKKMKMAQFADKVFPDGEVAYEIQIKLQMNPEDNSKFNWTIRQEKTIDMSTGTVCDVRAITRRRSVARYVFESAREEARKVHRVVFE